MAGDVQGGVRGRTGFAPHAAARLFLVLRAQRVSSCFQDTLFARFVWFAPPPPLPFINVTRTRSSWESSLRERMSGGGI